LAILLGFLIAVAIAITGVGAGSLTTPILMLFLGVPPAIAVGTALTFGFVVKVVSAPIYLVRKQVDFRVLAFLLLGGLPGVVLGSLWLGSLQKGAKQSLLYVLIGSLIGLTALFHLWRMTRPRVESAQKDRAKYLPWFAFPIGIEVGFSSAGAGALGSLLLLGFTALTTAAVVGTDLCFGLLVSLIGSGFQISNGNYDLALLTKLLIGGVAGAVTGSFLAGRVAQRPLRVALLIMLVILGSQLCWRGLESPPAPKVKPVIESGSNAHEALARKLRDDVRVSQRQ
jgi:uncharacterized protein